MISESEIFFATTLLLTCFNAVASLFTFLAARTKLLDSHLPSEYQTERLNSRQANEHGRRRPLILFNMAWTTLAGASFASVMTQPSGVEPVRILVEAGTCIAAYHIGFYVIHRTQHMTSQGGVSALRWIKQAHRIHHKVRLPYATDFLYEHPIDILVVATIIFGALLPLLPISLWSWWAILAHHNIVGILDHSGLLRNGNHLAHHSDHPDANFAMASKKLDLLFGTSRRSSGR